MKKGLIRHVRNMVMIAAVSSVICGCSMEKEQEVKGYDSEFMFDTKCAVEEGEDGWVYYFCCDYDKGKDIPYTYYYNGFNLKHKSIEGYAIDIRDTDGNVISQAQASMPILVLNSAFDADLATIDTYFEKKLPTDVITGDDLSLNDLDKEQVIRLFNKAILSDRVEAGKYYNLPEAEVVQGENSDGYYWQVGYLSVHGQLVSVDIELIYGGDIHLSDIVAAGNADESQKELERVICDIEDKIVEEQEFCQDDGEFKRIKGASGSKLKSVLKGIDTRSQE